MPRHHGGFDQDFHIRYFDPRVIRQNCIIFIIGRRGTGKSTVAATLMKHFTNIKEGICVSKTDKMNQFWAERIPSPFIHHEYSSTITQKLIMYQEKKWQRIRRECAAKGMKADPSMIEPVFAIYDDVTYDKTFLRDAATRELFMNGRHYNILVVITCQYLMDMGPDLRQQVDYCIALKDNIRDNLEKMWVYFAGVFNDFLSFYKTFRRCTENREAIVLKNAAEDYRISESVFFFRGETHLTYRMGTDAMWEITRELERESLAVGGPSLTFDPTEDGTEDYAGSDSRKATN